MVDVPVIVAVWFSIFDETEISFVLFQERLNYLFFFCWFFFIILNFNFRTHFNQEFFGRWFLKIDCNFLRIIRLIQIILMFKAFLIIAISILRILYALLGWMHTVRITMTIQLSLVFLEYIIKFSWIIVSIHFLNSGSINQIMILFHCFYREARWIPVCLGYKSKQNQ